MKKYRLTLWLILLAIPMAAQPYTKQDTLRGSNGRGRDWWDVVRYDLHLNIDTANRSIEGMVNIDFKVVGEVRDSMQIDLQEGLDIDFAAFEDTQMPVVREGNVYWIKIPRNIKEVYKKDAHAGLISIEFHGKPRVATNPPWDGGFIWTKDSMGKPWIAVACQGLGASSWWPCKDYQGDEPDSGMTVGVFYFENSISSIINGVNPTIDSAVIRDPRTDQIVTVYGPHEDNIHHIRNPINAYDVTFYIGDYAHYHDTLQGEKGILDLDFYPLRYNEAKARKHWAVTKEMLHCFEYWMGPYPFYEDGYKLVEAPYLGMEHQSAVAYGNQYKMGYLGRDRSGTGVGLAFDFIIVHESGHEWFGNSITAQDIADNWLHEGFTTYTETLFAEWIKGKDSAYAYSTGEWKNIKNDRPVIGDYGVNKEGSGDMYDKGSAVVHMIRLMLNDDQKFRQLLRGLNKDFYHKIVTSKQVEDYISRFTGHNLKPFFDVYLRSTAIPTLSYSVKKSHGKKYCQYEWRNTPAGFIASVQTEDGSLIALTNGGASIQTKELKAVGIYNVERY